MSQQCFKNFDNPVANFFRPDVSAQICRSQLQAALVLRIQSFSHGGLDELCLLLEAERVAQKHGGTEDGADGIGDPLARDVGSGTVDGLIETGCGLERGRGGERRRACERRGWEESQRAWDDARLVGKSVYWEEEKAGHRSI